MSHAIWERAEIGNRTVLNKAIADIGSLNDAIGHACFFHDPSWLLEAEDRSSRDVALYLCWRDTEIIGYAPFVIQPWSMRFLLGEITLFSRRFQRLHVHGGPVLRPDGVSESELAVTLFTGIKPDLNSRQAVYLEGVVREGPIERALDDPRVRRSYHILRLGPPYERRLIRLAENFDVYLQSLKKHTRQNLRTGYRKLANHLGDEPKLIVCTTPAQVPQFVSKAVAISRKTYQWHLLGLGLRKPEQLERTLTAMAARGWTKCYLLECGGVPTAFMIGYQYWGTYHYVDVGFDPDWEKFSVGTMLHLAVLRELTDSADRPQWFDFSSGTGPQKERFSNQSRPEANYLLVPRNVRGFLLVAMYRGTGALSNRAVWLLDKLRLKAALKKLIRRRSTANVTAE